MVGPWSRARWTGREWRGSAHPGEGRGPETLERGLGCPHNWAVSPEPGLLSWAVLVEAASRPAPSARPGLSQPLRGEDIVLCSSSIVLVTFPKCRT